MKTHLARNSSFPFPVCNRAFRAGNFSTPLVMLAKEFKTAPESEVCEYCAAELVKMRNRIRTTKGLSPITKYND